MASTRSDSWKIPDAASFGPPRGAALALGNRQCRLLLVQSARAPGFELLADDFRRHRGRYDRVHVIRSAIDGVQHPAFVLACLCDLFLNALALLRRQAAGILGHACRSFEFQDRVGKLEAMLVIDPATDVAG